MRAIRMKTSNAVKDSQLLEQTFVNPLYKFFGEANFSSG
ncbi:hypothetical protein SD77_1695 [Bacillus badius]|uniref:Mobile element protein n=1 Tax=Bacillus badius TaxID=1455 RepID=A0ABR5AR76_BACBA|nr:hypothetical protein SD77_1695 [Bacillus badius]